MTKSWLRQLRFCHGEFSRSRGRVCHITGHTPCLCQVIYTYVHFQFVCFFNFLKLFLIVYTQDVCVYSCNSQPFRYLKVHYRLHKSPTLVPILSHMDPVHNFHTFSLRSILILSSHLNLDLPSVSSFIFFD
jgi:hypothetical protein